MIFRRAGNLVVAYYTRPLSAIDLFSFPSRARDYESWIPPENTISSFLLALFYQWALGNISMGRCSHLHLDSTGLLVLLYIACHLNMFFKIFIELSDCLEKLEFPQMLRVHMPYSTEEVRATFRLRW